MRRTTQLRWFSPLAAGIAALAFECTAFGQTVVPVELLPASACNADAVRNEAARAETSSEQGDLGRRPMLTFDKAASYLSDGPPNPVLIHGHGEAGFRLTYACSKSQQSRRALWHIAAVADEQAIDVPIYFLDGIRANRVASLGSAELKSFTSDSLADTIFGRPELAIAQDVGAVRARLKDVRDMFRTREALAGLAVPSGIAIDRWEGTASRAQATVAFVPVVPNASARPGRWLVRGYNDERVIWLAPPAFLDQSLEMRYVHLFDRTRFVLQMDGVQFLSVPWDLSHRDVSTSRLVVSVDRLKQAIERRGVRGFLEKQARDPLLVKLRNSPKHWVGTEGALTEDELQSVKRLIEAAQQEIDGTIAEAAATEH